MNERSSILKRDDGYFYPFVLFVIVLLISILITSTIIYQNEQKISSQLIEQMYAQSLVQLSKATFVKEHPHLTENEGTLHYEFPLGEVAVHYKKISYETIVLEMDVTTMNDTFFNINVLLYK